MGLLPDWFSPAAQREAEQACEQRHEYDADGVFGAAYNEGCRDERKRLADERKHKPAARRAPARDDEDEDDEIDLPELPPVPFEQWVLLWSVYGLIGLLILGLYVAYCR